MKNPVPAGRNLLKVKAAVHCMLLLLILKVGRNLLKVSGLKFFKVGRYLPVSGIIKIENSNYIPNVR